jgi:hypothetical protein
MPRLAEVFTRAQDDSKAGSILKSAAPSSIPAWVLKNPNSKFARAIMRRMAAKHNGESGQVWCGAYVCD